MFDRNLLPIKDGLCDKDLVKAIINKAKSSSEYVKYESDAVAIVQCYKRSKHDVRKFVDRANFIIRDSKSKCRVLRCQEGVTRIIVFTDAAGRVEVTEQFGNIFLNSFVEADQK